MRKNKEPPKSAKQFFEKLKKKKKSYGLVSQTKPNAKKNNK